MAGAAVWAEGTALGTVQAGVVGWEVWAVLAGVLGELGEGVGARAVSEAWAAPVEGRRRGC